MHENEKQYEKQIRFNKLTIEFNIIIIATFLNEITQKISSFLSLS